MLGWGWGSGLGLGFEWLLCRPPTHAMARLVPPVSNSSRSRSRLPEVEAKRWPPYLRGVCGFELCLGAEARGSPIAPPYCPTPLPHPKLPHANAPNADGLVHGGDDFSPISPPYLPHISPTSPQDLLVHGGDAQHEGDGEDGARAHLGRDLGEI